MSKPRETPTKWEYRTVKTPASGGFLGGKFDNTAFVMKLNELGDEGWELVAATTTNQGYGQSRELVAVFKRERK
jgi:hypothetical protein